MDDPNLRKAMYELRDCPFCGGKAYFLQTAYGTDRQAACLQFVVCCRKCKATAPGSTGKIVMRVGEDGEIKFERDERQLAVTMWNKRANDGCTDVT